jgi:hypothetical protein
MKKLTFLENKINLDHIFSQKNYNIFKLLSISSLGDIKYTKKKA